MRRKESVDVLSEKCKWGNLATANIERVKGAKYKKLVVALAIEMEQLNAKNSTATDKGIKDRTNIICTYCTLVLF